jgi:hypothetical protein
MPLTFSHPAIVLPLSFLPKRWVSVTGLIIGSVAPDFEYFGRMKVFSTYSHTWAGLFWFDLPVAILLTFVYHDIVRNAFISNLPGLLKSRLAPNNTFNWNQYFIKNLPVVILSILIGSASHLFWDSFTHITGYFVVLWNMAGPISLFGSEIPLYKLIQHLSTLLGGVVIITAIYQMPVSITVTKKRIWPYWFMVIGIAILIVGLRLLFGLSFHRYWDILVTAISGAIIAVVLTSSFFKSKSRDS